MALSFIVVISKQFDSVILLSFQQNLLKSNELVNEANILFYFTSLLTKELLATTKYTTLSRSHAFCKYALNPFVHMPFCTYALNPNSSLFVKCLTFEAGCLFCSSGSIKNVWLQDVFEKILNNLPLKKFKRKHKGLA